MKSGPFNNNPRNRQHGAALLVVMMVLLILTLLGIASLRGGIMQERMAANIATRSMSFQVAEAGLRQAELIARDGTVTFPSAGCAAGRCAKEAGWESNNDFWDDGEGGYQTGTAISIGNSSLNPRFIIEDYGTTSVLGATSSCIDMSKPCISGTSQNVYRITSYARTPNGAEVILQSLYKR
ncbi:PilX N-terminal domain-containing pilus assembly protein [Luteimonas soli]|uniref:PilX N-terminal domain-containing pilus assembly protein n=1 Tax=Luteimonas soli TaxID=1648966 RepID=A0ABV7XMI7_9GAMM